MHDQPKDPEAAPDVENLPPEEAPVEGAKDVKGGYIIDWATSRPTAPSSDVQLRATSPSNG